MSNSRRFQPPTIFKEKRPPEIASIVAACLATMSGCAVGACEVANTDVYRVACARPAAQENASSTSFAGWLGLSSRYPFQRAIGTIASSPLSSATRAIAKAFVQVGRRTSGTKVMFGIAFVQNVPSFSLFSLKIGFVG